MNPISASLTLIQEAGMWQWKVSANHGGASFTLTGNDESKKEARKAALAALNLIVNNNVSVE